MKKEEKLDVKFSSRMSKFKNCTCDACHNTTMVIKIRFPETKYFDGRGLETRYSEYWLCARCRNKLSDALIFPDEGGDYDK